MQELTHVGVELRMAGNMTQRIGQFQPCPCIDGRAARQMATVNVNHTGIRRTQFINMFQCVRIDLLRECKSVAAGFSQSDQFFQPRCTSGLDVHARSGFGKGFANNGIQAELVATAVDAEFQIGR